MSVSVDVAKSGPTEPSKQKRWALHRRKRPLLPPDDPFYVAPPEFAALSLGTIIRTREVRVALFGRIPQQVQAWQLLYRTMDLNGRPEAAVTTILLPAGADPAAQRPILAFQCAIDAVSADCFPSYVLQRGAKTLGTFVAFELLFIGSALRKGWTVVVTDHEGLDGGFGIPREPGYRVLDAVRAVMRFAPLRIDPETSVAAWGYSGGGMATSWVVEMAPTYAPEINLVGGVLGAPVGDPESTFKHLTGTFHAGLATVVISALRRKFPAMSSLIANHVNLEGRRHLDLATTLTPVEAVLKFRGHDLGVHVDEPLAELLTQPDMVAMFDELRLGMSKPDCPLLVVQAVHDQIIPVRDIDQQVQRYRDNGADVTYVKDRLSEHISGLPISVPISLAWISERFDGEPTSPGTSTVWTLTTNIRGFASMGLTAARMIAGLSVASGPPHRRNPFRRSWQLPHRRAS